MPKMLMFSHFAFRDFIATAGLPTLLVVLLCIAAYRWIDPAPPRHVTMSTGQENSA